MTTQGNTFKTSPIWKDIEGYVGIYQVSNFGEVRSLDRSDALGRKVKGVIIKPQVTKKGYLQVSLCKNGKQKSCKIHRLVAKAFIPNNNHYSQVNHIDEDKENNCLDNLEWCNNLYNSNWGTRNKRVAEKNSNGVYAIDKHGNYTHYASESDASRNLKIPTSAVNAITNRIQNRKSYKGYTFVSDEYFDVNNIYSYMQFEKGIKVCIKTIEDGSIQVFYSLSDADMYYDKWKGYFSNLYRKNNKKNNLFEILKEDYI